MVDQAESSPRPLQLFVKLLNGETLSLQFPAPQVLSCSVKQRIYETTKIPVHLQRLIRGHQLEDNSVISHSNATLNLSLRLLGGKGGFGSLLRGAATKAGQKKTSNFEACRDMSGRRLRHVNAERRLEEWKAEEEERRLEKIAEEFLKKKAKTGKKGVGDGEAEKYVKKYREESAKCVAVVEESVKEACRNGKRKAIPGGLDAKKLKIWMGKRVLDGSDSEDMDDSCSEDEETEKSVVLNNGDHSDSSKGTEGSSGSVTQCSGGTSCECGSQEEKEIVTQQSLESGGKDIPNVDNGMVEPEIDEKNMAQSTSPSCVDADLATGTEAVLPKKQEQIETEPKTENKEELCCQASHFLSSEKGVVESQLINAEVIGSSDSKSEAVDESTSITESDKPLNFDEYNSSEELEVLGMERLKSELQARGLKCGGTLQERAARLFLLKSTLLEKLPKKLLAKK